MPDAGLKVEVDTAFARATLTVLQNLPKDLRRKVELVLREEAKQIARDARTILRDPSRAPVSRTGETARLTRHRRGRGGLSYLVETRKGSDGPVGLFLEAGTQRGGRRVNSSERRLVTNRRGLAQLVVRRRSERVGGIQRSGAFPYITAALEERQATTARNLAKAIAEALDEAAERAGG